MSKPIANVVRKDGNVFVTLSISSKALKNAGLKDQAKEMEDRVFRAEDYNDALNIMKQYVDFA